MARGVARGAVRDAAGNIIAPVRVRVKQGGVYVTFYLTETDTTGVTQADFADGFYEWWRDPGRYDMELYKQTGGVWDTTPFIVLSPFFLYPQPDNIVETDRAKTITAVHTFNPSSVGAPFVLGSNAQGQLVPGLNAQYLQGKTPADLQGVTKRLVTVRFAADKTLATNTPVVLPFDYELYDVENTWDAANYVFNANMSALYLFEIRLGMTITDWRFTFYLSIVQGSTEDIFLRRNRSYTTSGGAHTHTVSLGVVSTSSVGNHTHSFSGTTNTTGAHTHNVNSPCSACGPTSSAGDHYHSFSGTTSAEGAHYHTVNLGTPTTSSAGAHSHEAAFDRDIVNAVVLRYLRSGDQIAFRALVQNTDAGFPTTWTAYSWSMLHIVRLAT